MALLAQGSQNGSVAAVFSPFTRSRSRWVLLCPLSVSVMGLLGNELMS